MFLNSLCLHPNLVSILDIKIIEEKKNRLIFEVVATHTLCNLLKDELYNDESVKSASYTIEHPLIGKPKMIVETTGTDVRSAVLEALQRLKRYYEKIEKDLVKELR